MLRFLLVALFCAPALFAQGAFNFTGTGGGAIPDGGSTIPETLPGTPVAVSFAVSGVTGEIDSIALVVSMDHTFVGDLRVALYAPGGTPSTPVFWRVGANSASSAGYPAQLNGTYTFSDVTGTANFWGTAQSAGTGLIPTGPSTYLAESPGGQSGGGVSKMMYPTFSSLSEAEINGTWQLIFQDVTQGDTGSVTGASLVIGTVSTSGGGGGDDGGDESCSAAEGAPSSSFALLVLGLVGMAVIRTACGGRSRSTRSWLGIWLSLLLLVAPVLSLTGCESTRTREAKRRSTMDTYTFRYSYPEGQWPSAQDKRTLRDLEEEGWKPVSEDRSVEDGTVHITVYYER